MDIHKPKPVHNLREFLSEIAVIVIGVAIALTGEQAVEALHWRHQVAEADHSLGQELSETIGQSDEREIISDCVERRLDLLGRVIARASATGHLPPLGDIGSPPVRTWSSGVWQSAIGAQTIAHMPVSRSSIYSVAYGFIEVLDRTAPRELEVWSGLYAAVGPGRPLGQDEAGRLLSLVSQARTFNQLMASFAVRTRQLSAISKFELNEKFRRSFDRPPASYSICLPPGPVPDTYGRSPIDGSLKVAEANPERIDQAFLPRTTRSTQRSATPPAPAAGATH